VSTQYTHPPYGCEFNKSLKLIKELIAKFKECFENAKNCCHISEDNISIILKYIFWWHIPVLKGFSMQDQCYNEN